MKNNKNYLKKQLIYRCTHSGTKESDILYKKLIIKKLDYLNLKEIKLIIDLFNNKSDKEISLLLQNNKKINSKYKKLIEKIN